MTIKSAKRAAGPRGSAVTSSCVTTICRALLPPLYFHRGGRHYDGSAASQAAGSADREKRKREKKRTNYRRNCGSSSRHWVILGAQKTAGSHSIYCWTTQRNAEHCGIQKKKKKKDGANFYQNLFAISHNNSQHPILELLADQLGWPLLCPLARITLTPIWHWPPHKKPNQKKTTQKNKK